MKDGRFEVRLHIKTRAARQFLTVKQDNRPPILLWRLWVMTTTETDYGEVEWN